MYSLPQLKKHLDYARYVRIAFVFMVAMLLYLGTTIPENRWILLTALIISAGIEPGLIIQRSIQRFFGTVAALLFVIPLFYLIQLNYRFIPVLLIVSLIGVNVTSVNAKYYATTAFFITVSVFLLLAQINTFTSAKGLFETVINRGVCTVIGTTIVLLTDYFLLHRYHYSHKLYLLHQWLVYDLFKRKIKHINSFRQGEMSPFLFIERTRDQIIERFIPIAISAENLRLERKVSQNTKDQIVIFERTIWELRRALFALYLAKMVLKSPDSEATQLRRINELMLQAKNNFIRIE